MATHRVLIVGTGSIGERHLRCFGRTGRATIGMVEIVDGLRRQVAERYDVTDAFASLDEALTRKWDAAVIAAPAHVHIPIASQLADAGIHLFIEKPLATSLDGIEELQAKIRKRGLLSSVAYVYRSHPGLTEMRRHLQSGTLGKPVQIQVTCGASFPFYRPAYREVYFAHRAQGGGAIQDALPHMLNAGEWLVGPIDHVCADAAHQVLEGVEVEDTVHVLTRHGSVLGCYCLNLHQAPSEITMKVVCDHGTVRFDLHEQRWRWMVGPDSSWQEQSTELADRDAWFIAQADLFLDALEGKAEPTCTIDEATQTLKVVLKILAMADSGEVLQAIG